MVKLPDGIFSTIAFHMVFLGEIFNPDQALAGWRQGLDGFLRNVDNLQQQVGEVAFLATGIPMEPKTLKYFYPGYDEYRLALGDNPDGLIYIRESHFEIDEFRRAKKKLIIVGSTTAGGQTTIVRNLCSEYGGDYNLVPTVTNRPRNPNREDEQAFTVERVIPYLDIEGVRTTSYYHVHPGDLLSLQLFWNETVDVKTSTWWRTYASLKHHFDHAITGKQTYSLCTVDYDGLDEITAWMKRYHPGAAVMSLFVMSRISQKALEERIAAKRPPGEVKFRIEDARNDIRQTGKRDSKPNAKNPVCENQMILLNPPDEVDKAVQALHTFLQSLKR